MFSSNGQSILEREPKFEDITCSLSSVRKLPVGILGETRELSAPARHVNDEVARPRALELDRMKREDGTCQPSARQLESEQQPPEEQRGHGVQQDVLHVIG